MTDTNPNFFPLTYDSSSSHTESWEKGKSYEGKKVTITRKDGSKVTGRVHRAEQACDESRQHYGVGFMLLCGQGIGAYNVPVRADFTAIESHREPDYIRV